MHFSNNCMHAPYTVNWVMAKALIQIVIIFFNYIWPLALATTWPLYPASCFSDNYGRYLLQKKQILRSLYPRSLFMYWRRFVKGVVAAKASATAFSKVAKPNGHCALHFINGFEACYLGAMPLKILAGFACTYFSLHILRQAWTRGGFYDLRSLSNRFDDFFGCPQT